MGKKLQTAGQALKVALPSELLRERRTKSVISSFAEDVGMVYFGYTSQRNDEHRLLRGLTTSNSHVDRHYCVGSFQGYDTALVVRREKILDDTVSSRHRYWTIVTFDLHTTYDVPPLFMSYRQRRELIESKYVSLSDIPMIHSAPAQTFSKHWRLFAKMGQALEVQSLLNDALLAGISNHFDHLAVEVSDNTVYVYSDIKHPTRAQLERQMGNGLWFAQHLDAAAEYARHQLED